MSHARQLIEVAFRELPTPNTEQWKVQAWAGGDSWGDIKFSDDDGRSYQDEFYPSKEAAEREIKSMPQEGPGEYRAVPANTRSDVDYYEGANDQNES